MFIEDDRTGDVGDIIRGIFNREYIVAPRGKKLGPYSEIKREKDYFVVKKNGKYGFVENSFVIEPKIIYNEVIKDELKGGYIVRKSKNWGYVNNFGSELVPPIYTSVESTSKGIRVISKENGMFLKGLLSYYDGKPIVPCKYIDILETENGYIVTNTDNKKGFIKDGIEILPCKYRDIKDYGEYIVAENGSDEAKIFDKNGNQLLSKNYNHIIPSEYGFIVSKFVTGQGTLYGLIDKEENEVTPLKYKYILSLGESLKARGEQGFGILSNSGEEIIPCQYENIRLGKYGYVCKNSSDESFEFYNTDGEQLLKGENNPIIAIEENDGFIAYKHQGGWCFLTSDYDKLMNDDGSEVVLSDKQKMELDKLLNSKLSDLPNAINKNSEDIKLLKCFCYLARCQADEQIEKSDDKQEIANITKSFGLLASVVVDSVAETAKTTKRGKDKQVESIKNDALKNMDKNYNSMLEKINKESENE